MKLYNGFKLAYAEYGDMNGKPVFFFHGTPGSRYFRPPDKVTKKMGVRLICVDRPGYGESEFQPGRRILDWPENISQLADFLKIGKFAVAAHSGGGPYALACANLIPGRVTASAIMASVGPFNTPGLTRGMVFGNKLGFIVGRFVPWSLWQLLIWIFYRRRKNNPEADMDTGKGQRPPADEEQISQPEIREVCIQSEIESFRHGLRALAWDARLLTHPWGFSMKDIQIPVHLWHGSVDDQAPIFLAQFMAEKIPGSTLMICENEGHLLLFHHWEEILKQLR